MPIIRDFRQFAFSPVRVDRCGKYVGRRLYWKLYSVENLLRIFINSVLSAQIHPRWWDVAVDPQVQRRAETVRRNYIRRASHTMPGGHAIYYVFLPDLNNIIRANSNLVLPIVPDIDHWIARIEGIRLPRNLVGHMNFPNKPDSQKIDDIYAQIPALISQLSGHGLAIQIP